VIWGERGGERGVLRTMASWCRPSLLRKSPLLISLVKKGGTQVVLELIRAGIFTFAPRGPAKMWVPPHPSPPLPSARHAFAAPSTRARYQSNMRKGSASKRTPRVHDAHTS
jgi:hypothetical protein